MSARLERIEKTNKSLPARRIKPEKVVMEFDPERLKAPFLLRCGALLIDYVLIISVPVVGILLARLTGEDGAKLLNSEINNTSWLIAILLGVTNFVILPMFTGQSVGKMLTGLRVVSTDGTIPTFWKLFLRHFVGYPLTVLTGGLGFLISAFNENGRSLNDLIGGTVVVYGRRRVEEKLLSGKKLK
ncbi:MAG: RDD family protein [Pyrinomonadaceae bacterium]|nr:RDD family protein [Pyrinomonadaceae bacterium]